MAQQGSLGAENGLLGRGGAGMPRYMYVFVLGMVTYGTVGL